MCHPSYIGPCWSMRAAETHRSSPCYGASACAVHASQDGIPRQSQMSQEVSEVSAVEAMMDVTHGPYLPQENAGLMGVYGIYPLVT